jgi:hypothetical protein
MTPESDQERIASLAEVVQAMVERSRRTRRFMHHVLVALRAAGESTDSVEGWRRAA